MRNHLLKNKPVWHAYKVLCHRLRTPWQKRYHHFDELHRFIWLKFNALVNTSMSFGSKLFWFNKKKYKISSKDSNGFFGDFILEKLFQTWLILDINTEKVLEVDWTKYISDKHKKYLSVGNSGILSVICGLLPASCLQQLMKRPKICTKNMVV